MVTNDEVKCRMRGNMFVTNQMEIILLRFYHSYFENAICVTARLHYVQENSVSKERQASRICLARLQDYLKYVCLKHFSETFELYLLQGSYTVKNIPLNFYITEISLFSEYLQKCSQAHKSNYQNMLYKNRQSLAFWLIALTWNFT